MPEGPQRTRQIAWLLWRSAALGASVWIAEAEVSAGPPGAALPLLAAVAWAFAGWGSPRPVRLAGLVAAAVLAAAILAWHLPPTVALFLPIWGLLFWAPLAAAPSGAAARAASRNPALGSAARRASEPLRDRAAEHPRATEALRLAVIVAAGAAAFFPFLHDGVMGGTDAKWYASVVADAVEQARAGTFPFFVGETRFAAVGTVMPLRVAPYLQHLTLGLDLLTGRSLSPYLLLNLAVFLSGAAGALSAYLCLRPFLPGRRNEALMLAAIYVWCPAVVGLAYDGQLFMSAMTLPFLPMVFAGLVRIFERADFSGWAQVAAGCAACWIAHSPIGLWATASAALALALRWALGLGWNLAEARRAAGAALLFALLCGYVFVSIGVLAPPATAPTVAATLPPILDGMFPAVLEPVSPDAGAITDLQPGWSVLAVLVGACAVGLARRSRLVFALAGVAGLLVCLSFPVPIVNDLLWRALPQAVVNVTNAVPTQRLFPILAACAVALAAAVLSASPRRPAWLLPALMASVLWSGIELGRFVHRGSLIANTRAASQEALSETNLTSTSFSTGLLSEANRFFSNGYMEFPLEQRILAPHMQNYLETDVGAVAPGYDFGPRAGARQLPDHFTGTAAADGRRWIELTPRLVLEPGRHYLLALDFPEAPLVGVLQIHGKGLAREYILPASGRKWAFGSDRACSRVLPLSSGASEPTEVSLDFVVQDPDADLERFRDFARYALIPYDPSALPMVLASYAPYVARVRSPAPGWYESFRYFTPGWTATVDGRSAELRRSPNGLIAVAVGAGTSEVRLAYKPPGVLSASYAVMGAAWLGLCGVSLARGLRPNELNGGWRKKP